MPPKGWTRMNAEELIEKVDRYFSMCDESSKPYTITGLCVFLGVCKDTLIEYGKTDEMGDIVRLAKLKIENYVEENSLTGKLNPTTCIFNLKNNFGWKDKHEVDQTIGNKEGEAFKVETLSPDQQKLLDRVAKRVGEVE